MKSDFKKKDKLRTLEDDKLNYIFYEIKVAGGTL